MKTLIRRWLCEHKETSTYRSQKLIDYKHEVGEPEKVIWFKIWAKCKNCGKMLSSDIHTK